MTGSPPPQQQAPPPQQGQPQQYQAPQQQYQQPMAAAPAADPFAAAHGFIKMKFIMLGVALGVGAIILCSLLVFVNNLLVIPSAPLGSIAILMRSMGLATIFLATAAGGALLPGLSPNHRLGFFIIAGFVGQRL